jgi:hypothetical protein
MAQVEVRDNIIPPHAVPFASDSHGPLFIARAYLEVSPHANTLLYATYGCREHFVS